HPLPPDGHDDDDRDAGGSPRPARFGGRRVQLRDEADRVQPPPSPDRRCPPPPGHAGEPEGTQRRPETGSMTKGQATGPDRILDTIDAIVWEIDGTSGAYVFVSAHASRLLGHPTERWLEDPSFFREHVHPEDREALAACRARALASHEPYVCDYRL